MVQSCSAYNCTERFKRGTDISFHLFPRNLLFKKKWIVAMRRENFEPTQHSRICSKHFTSDSFITSNWSSIKKLKNDAVPSIFDFPSNLKTKIIAGKPTALRNIKVQTEDKPDLSINKGTPNESPIEPSIKKKRLYYLGDFKQYHPSMIHVVKTVLVKKQKQIKILQQQNRRLIRRVSNLKSLLKQQQIINKKFSVMQQDSKHKISSNECSGEAKISYQFEIQCEKSEEILNTEQNYTDCAKDEELLITNISEEDEPSINQEKLETNLPQETKHYKCLECGKQYRYKQGLRRHNKQHSLNPSKCSYCDYTPETPIALGKHMEMVHEDKKDIKCSLCDKKFFRKSNLKVHMMIHSGIKQYTCEICGLSFAISGNLVAHKRLHTGEKPYKCMYCGKSFSQTGSLRSHLVIHSNVKNHVCNMCGAAFSRSIALKNHQVRHSKDRPFKCTLCNKAFAFNSDMKRHMMIHSGIKKFQCEFCEKQFNRNANLQVHLKMHTGETPHVCHICGKGFIQAHCLRTHINAHKEDSD